MHRWIRRAVIPISIASGAALGYCYASNALGFQRPLLLEKLATGQTFLDTPFFGSPQPSASAASDVLPDASNTLRRPGSAHNQQLSRYFIADAVSKAHEGIVSIQTEQEIAWFVARGSGSGFIIDDDGTIVTNAHVVEGANSGLTVVLTDGRAFQGRVIASDLLSDVALVKIDSREKLPYCKLGDSDKLRVGELVVAVGSPLALSNTVTHGIISALDRRGVDLGMRSQSTFIQTDSAINQGNSGGPLLNLDGDVIGINSMKAAGVAGISFAIPINYAKDIVEQLRKHGRVLRPYIGIKMTTLTPDVVAFLKRRDRKFASSGVSEGVFVPEVADGSPAQRAGLKPNDIIVSINGRAVTSTDEVMDIIGKRIDQTLEIEVRRGPKSKFFSVKPTVGRPDAFLRD